MRSMRRKDRELSRDLALSVTDKCACSVVATVNEDGTPYCVPLSLARKGEWLYFHTAKEGHKIDNLRRYNKVCVSCADGIKAIPGDFSIEYESALINGTASEVTDEEEKISALRLISLRFTPDNMAAFDKEVKQSLDKTGVWKIHIDEISGKAKKLNKPAL